MPSCPRADVHLLCDNRLIHSLVASMLGPLIQNWRIFKLTNRGAVISLPCSLGPAIGIGARSLESRVGGLFIGPYCDVGRGVEFSPWGGDIRIGQHVFIGPYAVLYGHGGIDIGDHTLISMHCCILSSNHAALSRGKLIREQSDELLPTKIGRDVWLGAGVKVLGGASIGDGCVVGAGAVVSGDLPAYSIAVGVPARIISRRE